MNTDLNIAAEPEWSVTLEPPTNEEIAVIIQELKRGKAAGQMNFPPHYSKMVGLH